MRTRMPRGFTLIELMTTITIAAILLAIAVPSFQTYRANQQVRSAATELLAAFNFARSEAIKRNASIAVAPAATWNDGWSVRAGATELRNFSAPSGVDITASSSPTFTNEGRLPAAITFTIAPSVTDAVASRCVRLNTSGKSNNRTGACS